MSVKEMVVHELDTLDESALEQVADYLSFLKFRARKTSRVQLPDSLTLSQLYAEIAQEDRQLAEQGIADYRTLLLTEDMQ